MTVGGTARICAILANHRHYFIHFMPAGKQLFNIATAVHKKLLFTDRFSAVKLRQ